MAASSVSMPCSHPGQLWLLWWIEKRFSGFPQKPTPASKTDTKLNVKFQVAIK